MLLLMPKILKHQGCFRDTGPWISIWRVLEAPGVTGFPSYPLILEKNPRNKIWDHQIYTLVFFNPNKTKQHSVFS